MDGSEFEKPEYLARSKRILAANASAGRHEVDVAGLRFVVLPGVFSPKYFMDSHLFAENFPYRAEDDFLEVGCGAGALSILAALKGAKRVVATDINPAAVENCRENAERHGVAGSVSVLLGDLYVPVAGMTFDTIYWNTPFAFVGRDDLTMLERAAFNPHYAALERFVAGAASHLKPGGRLLLGFSTKLGQYSLLEQIATRHGYRLDLLKSFSGPDCNPDLPDRHTLPEVDFELYSLAPA